MSGFKDKEAKRRPSVAASMISQEAIREAQGDTYTTNIHNTHTQQTYTIPEKEKRSRRMQFVVKPSVDRKLDRLVQEGKIKSKNDLVNFLLESYIAQLEE